MDIFTEVYAALVLDLQAEAEVSSRIEIGNQIRYDGPLPDSPLKPQTLSGDLPELVVEPTDFTIDLYTTNHTETATQTFELRIATGDLRIDQALFPLQYAIWKALSRRANLQAVSGVSHVRVGGGINSQHDDEANRGTRQWSARWIIEIDIALTSAGLQS